MFLISLKKNLRLKTQTLTKRILIIFILIITTHIINGQNKYSLDKSKLKHNRSLTFQEQQSLRNEKKRIKTAEREERKKEKALDGIAKKYEEKYQTKAVRKRMNRSRKQSKKFNEGKPQVKTIEYIKYKTRKLYGRLF